jgi:hypothetical protein
VVFFSVIGRDLYRIDAAEPRFVTNLLNSGGALTNNSNFIGGGLFQRALPGHPRRQLHRRRRRRVAGALRTPRRRARPGSRRRSRRCSTCTSLAPATPSASHRDDGRRGAADPLQARRAGVHQRGARQRLHRARRGRRHRVPVRAAERVHRVHDADAASGNDFRQFNRALKGIVEMYRGFIPLQTARNPEAAPDAARLTAALAALDESFYSATATRAALDNGVYYTFSTASGETQNPLVDRGVFRVNARVISEAAEPNDPRIAAKVDTVSGAPISASGVTSRLLIRYPTTAGDRLALLKNSELVLSRAQILWALRRDDEALALVNLVRQASGLPARTVASYGTRVDFLVNGILKEKRVELLFESPVRWVDFRAMGILNRLGQERGANPVPAFPITNNEATARNGQIACQA